MTYLINIISETHHSQWKNDKKTTENAKILLPEPYPTSSVHSSSQTVLLNLPGYLDPVLITGEIRPGINIITVFMPAFKE
jgi:hypothetical protein